MIFRSRITKQASKVIEQNAWSRSWGSSINLMRTSVISTASSFSVAIGRASRQSGSGPGLGNPHAPQAGRTQPPRDAPRLAATAAQAEIRGSAAAHQVSPDRQIGKPLLQFGNLRVQSFRRLLQRIVQQAAGA